MPLVSDAEMSAPPQGPLAPVQVGRLDLPKVLAPQATGGIEAPTVLDATAREHVAAPVTLTPVARSSFLTLEA